MRILLITTNPPMPSQGGSMLLYRHFCEHSNFQIYVITNDSRIKQYDIPYDYYILEHSKLWNRLTKTRLSKHLHSCEHLFFGYRIPKRVWNIAQSFKPDAIFTIAGSWSWTTRLANNLAKKLQVPLIGSFMDWWYYNLIYAPWAEKLIESEFRKSYSQCDLAFCISEGMKTELGHHHNSVVLYPIGSKVKEFDQFRAPLFESVFTLGFAGNLGDWYGHMLEELITTAYEQNMKLNFKIFGMNQSWSNEFQKIVEDLNIYQGHISLEELRNRIKSVDALLLLMGFNESSQKIERTSFKSKFLDYISFQKPIFVWGPKYCSAVETAQKFDSAEVCISPKAEDILSIILATKDSQERQYQLIKNAQQMYEEEFHPDQLQSVFSSQIEKVIVNYK